VEAFTYRDNELWCEEVPLTEIARSVGTPVYIYSRASVRDHCAWFEGALGDLPHLSCYAVKANAGAPILREIAASGLGADVGSVGELRLALRAGFPPDAVTFSGVGKRDDEIEEALRAGIHSLNVESREELEAVDAIAGRLGVAARVLLRLNPGIDAPTHPYISTGGGATKFGMGGGEVRSIIAGRDRYANVRFAGLHSHIGSQIVSPGSFSAAARHLVSFFRELNAGGAGLAMINIGGGIGVRYRNYLAHPLLPQDPEAGDGGITTAGILSEILPDLCAAGVPVYLQPGRSIVAHSGILLSKVLYIKRNERKFVIVDAGMNDLMRPSLYRSWHQIVPVSLTGEPAETADVVGPLCETSDTLGEGRALRSVARGDLLAILCAGAYGSVLASNYNMRPRPAEVIVDGDRFEVFRRRESPEGLA
jgi:diaminopimelate decarboxylase